MASLYEQYLGNNRDYLYNTVGKAADQAGRDAGDQRVTGLEYKANADAAYDPLWNNEGGYGSQAKLDIANKGGLDSMTLSPEDQNSAYLTDDEAAGIKGDPSSRETYFKPGADLSATQGDYAKSNAIAGKGVDMSNAYSDQVNGIANPDALRQSADFASKYGMTDDQVNAAATAGARDASVVDNAAIDRAREAGAAAGMDPLGMASYTGRASRQAAQDAARAAATARVNAQQEQANRNLIIEQNRQGAEKTAQDQGLGAASAGYSARAGATTQQLNQQNQGNQAAQQQRQFNTNTGTGIAAAEENQRTGAATTLAQNRQATNLQNRNDVYSRQQYQDTANSTRAKQIADAQRADAQEGRQYLTNQNTQAQNLQQQDLNRQMTGYGTVSNGIQNNLALQAGYDKNNPSWTSKLINTGAQLAGAYLGA